MRCPFHKIDLKSRYRIENDMRAISFEYKACEECNRKYDLAGNEIILSCGEYVILKSGKKALK